jgi:EAL domain-containing protein (putative c-di-GMP-specific phosphodiesterase class I)/GGDEF domain-containing protein
MRGRYRHIGDEKINRICQLLVLFICGFLCVLFVIAFFIPGQNIRLNLANIPESTRFSDKWTNVATGENVTDGVNIASGETLTLRTTLPVYINEDEAILFLNNNFHLKIAIDGTVVDEQGNDNSLTFGRETGTVWTIFDLNRGYSGKTIEVSFSNSGKDRVLYLRSFIGPKSVLTTYLINSNGPLIAICVLLMLIGLAMIGYFALLRSRRVDFNYRLFLYLGLLTVFSALWLFLDSYITQFFIGNPTVRYLGSYFTFMLMPMALIMFFRELLEHYWRTFTDLLLCYLTAVLIIVLLYIFKIVHISQTISMVHGFILLTLAVTFITLNLEYFKYRQKEIKGPLTAFILLFAAAIAGLYLYYHSSSISNYDNSGIFSFGIVFFIIILLFTTVRQSLVKLSDIIFSQRYKELAYIDDVTGGNTLQKFRDDVQRCTANSRDYAVLIINLRHFKLLNESLGRESADEELKYFYNSLARAIDDDERVCRNAAEFILLIKAADEPALEKRYQAIRKTLEDCYDTYDRLLGYNACAYLIGATDDVNTMIDHARMAYNNSRADQDQNDGLWVYNDRCLEQLLLDQKLEDDAPAALEKGEFIPYLQPKISPVTGRLIGAEALVRWQRPDGSLVSPGVFIPLFERNGFIFDLDLYMFRQVCRIINKWVAEGITPPVVSVNLSKAALQRYDLFAKYEAVFREEQPPAQYLELEFTESMAYQDPAHMQNVIERIHYHGLKCSIDDFGSGYSNFNDLMQFDFDTVKLDKCFFDYGFPDNAKSFRMVSGLVAIFKRMGMTVIAEGIETEKQMKTISKLNCDAIQGFYYSRPLPVEDFNGKYF